MFTAKMMQMVKQETQEQQASQWTADRMRDMRTDALVSANSLHVRRWGVSVQALTAEIDKRNAK